MAAHLIPPTVVSSEKPIELLALQTALETIVMEANRIYEGYPDRNLLSEAHNEMRRLFQPRDGETITQRLTARYKQLTLRFERPETDTPEQKAHYAESKGYLSDYEKPFAAGLEKALGMLGVDYEAIENANIHNRDAYNQPSRQETLWQKMCNILPSRKEDPTSKQR